ncbi:MAG: class I SAM-dependent methyltransferase [Candidatus Promineifilaceae bacterium]
MTNPFSSEEMAAYWTAMIRDEINPFRKYVTDPALFDRLDNWPGPISILELGCGEGYIVRRLASQGHDVTGFDLSHPMLKAAEAAELHGSYFVNGDALQLPFGDGAFDAAVSNFLIVELPDPAAAIAEAARVLKPGGRFLFEIVHPFCFTDNAGQTSGQHVTDYFTSQFFAEKFVVDGRVSPLQSIRYHHPLSLYTQALAQHGFHITALEEPQPVPSTPADHPIREILKEPWFMIIEAIKI